MRKNKFKNRVVGWFGWHDRPFFQGGWHGWHAFRHGRKRQFSSDHATMPPMPPVLNIFFKIRRFQVTKTRFLGGLGGSPAGGGYTA